ncbi:replication protein A 14 kDa subunit B-like [Lathyrus oleraceus]|uniref:replication protein A 14 kDa subunit B-like n=1 Tax=Pisum sativum TaxID=3888 RepID=UPI0021D068E3|nr:replication protein A 14 kDa subunit B-like [Pisum sativum]
MDSLSPAVFVNVELLPFCVGRRVRTVIQVVRSEGLVVIGKSPDEKQIFVKVSPDSPLPSPLTAFVEVIGIVNSDKSIKAELWTNFGDEIDMFSYHKLCQLANGEFKHLFL